MFQVVHFLQKINRIAKYKMYLHYENKDTRCLQWYPQYLSASTTMVP